MSTASRKNPAAVSLGRKGGLAHGWKSMAPEHRTARAKTAVAARIAKRAKAKEPADQ